MSFIYIGGGGRWGTAHWRATYQPALGRQAAGFSACWKTIEGQGATKIHLARIVFFSVAKKDLSSYLYCFMGVKPHSVQIRSPKPQVLHIITQVEAVNPDGSMPFKNFMVSYFTDHPSKWPSCAQAHRKQPRPVHPLMQEIVKGSTCVFLLQLLSSV